MVRMRVAADKCRRMLLCVRECVRGRLRECVRGRVRRVAGFVHEHNVGSVF